MIEDWLESHIDDTLKYTGNREEVHFNCVSCEDTRHRMYVNLYSGKVYCHNCGYSSNIIGLIQYIEGISYTRASQVFKDIHGSLLLPEELTQNLVSSIFSKDQLRDDLVKRPISLPEEYFLIDPNHTNMRTKSAIKYLHSRKITDKQILKYKMGFCMSGEYKNRVIIPITENGELKFWVARAISKNVPMKEKSPSNEDYQISKSEVIFNIDQAAKKYHSCVICEGIFDALSWGDIGVSLLGKSLYQSQLNILLDYRELLTEGVYISLDWDAKDKAVEIADKLSDYFKVYIVSIPKELDDPNNCIQKRGRKYLLDLLTTAEEHSEFSSLRQLLS